MTILRLFFIFSLVINQASSLSISSNNANIGKTSIRKNNIVVAKKTSVERNNIIIEFNIKNKGIKELKKSINLTIKNKKAEKSNKNAKVSLKI